MTLTGRVLLGERGVAGVTVAVGGGVGSTTTNADGRYRIENLVENVTYTVTASKRYYLFPRKSIKAVFPSVAVNFNGSCNSTSIVLDGECWPADPALRDRDDDGLTDLEESQLGTDPRNVDTDRDEREDGQELLDGTNPIDRGSAVLVLSNTICSDWNGFLGGMYNIAEHVNRSRADLFLYSTLYDDNGEAESAVLNKVTRGAQFDLLVHGMPGWRLNAIGRVCTEHEGSPGDIDGAMVYYRPAPGSRPGENRFDVAVAMPYSKGIRGTQFVPFNTFQPSLAATDAQNFVANWVQLTNLSAVAAAGTLLFHAVDGSTIGTERVSLPGNARRDFSGHQFGPSKVGTIEWRPDSAQQRFQLRNVRYYLNNPGFIESFATALALEGMVGTGEEIFLPLDTRSSTAVIEVANTLNVAVEALITIYDAQGVLRETLRIALAPFASYHLIADPILKRSLGSAVIRGSKTNSIFAVGMQYGRTPALAIKHIYAIPGRQPLGSELSSSYNTNLGQGCRLLLVNRSNTVQSFSARMIRSDGTSVRGLRPSDSPPADYLPLGREQVLPPHGAADYDLCVNDGADKYGVIKLQVDNPSSLVGAVVRIGSGEQYRFFTPLRE